MITGYDISLFINGKTAVCITVKCKSRIQMIIQNELLQMFHMSGTAVDIDVQTVGSIADHIGVGAKCIKDAFSHLPCGTICAVEADLLSLIGTSGKRDQISDVAVTSRSVIHGTADILSYCIRNIVFGIKILLNSLQDRFFHLFAGTIEQLDAVIKIRIMAGGDHNAAVKIIGTGDIRYTGGCGDMHHICVRTGRSKSGAQCVFKHIAGTPGIFTDDDLSLVIFSVIPSEVATNTKCMFHCKNFICLAPESVSTKILHKKQISSDLCIRYLMQQHCPHKDSGSYESEA